MQKHKFYVRLCYDKGYTKNFLHQIIQDQPDQNQLSYRNEWQLQRKSTCMLVMLKIIH